MCLGVAHAAKAKYEKVPTYCDKAGECHITGMTIHPISKRILFVGKGGRVKFADTGEEFLTLPMRNGFPDVHWDSEAGFLGFEFHPNFPEQPYVYTHYTKKRGEKFQHLITRFIVKGPKFDEADTASEKVLLTHSAGPWHYGGIMRFGKDGMLYVAFGNGGHEEWRHNSQNGENLLGKMLRLSVDNPENLIPKDNPFVGNAKYRDEIWALGIRNCFGFAIDPQDGRLFFNDVGGVTLSGQGGEREEINEGKAGKNYGYPHCQGGYGSCRKYEGTVFDYDQWEDSKDGWPTGISATGAVFYRGNVLDKKYDGAYFFSDFGGDWLGVTFPNKKTKLLTRGLPAQSVALMVGPNGRLLMLTLRGQLIAFSKL